ncbi:hypothetical protein AB4Y38_24940 [Paraburkholderia sp. EG285A]|uniref:cupin domain-containing protein n=1 Tax=Paraburkholderia sp. EG285A TaxID=3237009 RepID=UPI0034D16922
MTVSVAVLGEDSIPEALTSLEIHPHIISNDNKMSLTPEGFEESVMKVPDEMLGGPRGQREAGVYVFDVSESPWQGVGKNGLTQKIVRRDDRTGHSFGFMPFDALARTGVHQHLGTAFSFFLSGALTDFQGTTGAGQLGVNFAGSTPTRLYTCLR